MIFRYCPYCAYKLETDAGVPYCLTCKLHYYRNAKPTACVFILDGDNVLLGKRAIEPFKGEWHVIGGFVNEEEHPEDAARREAKEETGLDIELTGILGMYIDEYLYEGGGRTLNTFYLGRVISGQMQANDDIAALEWFPIEELPVIRSFECVRQAAKDLQHWHATGEAAILR